MIGLADCNNFFVSCERVFRPELINKPVIVLSNNDGCAVALSNEAKALGFKRGDPYFKIRSEAERLGVVAFSGNHRLYGDMSRRVMLTLRSFCERLEIYSIDEGFLYFDDAQGDLASLGREIVHTVRRNTGIPVSIGLAPTKTLAKMAARFAKKYPGYRGSCLIDSADKARVAMSMTSVEDIWGVGRRNAPKLRRQGITTALQLADMSEQRVQQLFNIVGLRMWRELNGTPCIEQEIVAPQRKTITCSRTFAHDIYNYEELKQAIVTFVTIVARRLREHKLLAEAIEVWVCTNRFNTQGPRYNNSCGMNLDDSTADTTLLTAAAIKTLDKVWRKGIGFKRAGITISKCVAEDAATHSLFGNAVETAKRRRLMQAMDRINGTPANRHCLHLASMDNGLDTLTTRQHASRLYTTRLSDIIEIHVG